VASRRLPVWFDQMRWVLAAATLVNTLGNGMFLTGGVIFMTRSIGLSAARVGVALTVGALAALMAGPVAGDLADASAHGRC
jgi:multisubunit Na+/H+ antiporter MnhG subunit